MKNIKVGKVLLDLSCYCGEDLYSDGEIEDQLLELARKHTDSELNCLISEQYSWPLLYHFSGIRANIISWMPITGQESILEIGSGCGAITGMLAQKAGKVDCIELSKKRSMINAERNRERNNVTIHVGNYVDIEKKLEQKYDVITLIGVLEYASSYIQGTQEPYSDFLKNIRSHLKPNGKLVIAIENRVGLKYVAGCKEDHVGLIGEGLRGYPQTTSVRTFDKQELLSLLQASGFCHNEFYYPYPDYKFPNKIFTDDYLPSERELCTNYNNFDQERIELFSETEGFNFLIKNNLFPIFSNSFLTISQGVQNA